MKDLTPYDKVMISAGYVKDGNQYITETELRYKRLYEIIEKSTEECYRLHGIIGDLQNQLEEKDKLILFYENILNENGHIKNGELDILSTRIPKYISLRDQDEGDE